MLQHQNISGLSRQIYVQYMYIVNTDHSSSIGPGVQHVCVLVDLKAVLMLLYIPQDKLAIRTATHYQVGVGGVKPERRTGQTLCKYKNFAAIYIISVKLYCLHIVMQYSH